MTGLYNLSTNNSNAQTVSILKPHKQTFQTFVQRLLKFADTAASIKASATVSCTYLFFRSSASAAECFGHLRYLKLKYETLRLQIYKSSSSCKRKAQWRVPMRKHHVIKMYGGSVGKVSRTADHSTRWKLLFNFALCHLYIRRDSWVHFSLYVVTKKNPWSYKKFVPVLN
jgi:uncharacterized membrane protein YsdA (DUF1294 family)